MTYYLSIFIGFVNHISIKYIFFNSFFQICFTVLKNQMCPFQHWRIYWLKELKIRIGLSYSNHWLLYITWCVMETNVSSNIWLQATPISSWAIFLTKVVYMVRPNNFRCKLLFSQKFLTVKNAFIPELNPFYVMSN